MEDNNKQLERIEKRLDKIEEKLDNYLTQTNKNSADIVWLKGSVKFLGTLLVTAVAGMGSIIFNNLI